MEKIVLIRWLCPSYQEAEKLIITLLEKKWIACANIHSKVDSLYLWKEEFKREKEVLTEIKTKASNEKKVMQWISEHCSYEVPAILSFSIENSDPTFHQWIINQTSDL